MYGKEHVLTSEYLRFFIQSCEYIDRFVLIYFIGFFFLLLPQNRFSISHRPKSPCVYDLII